MAGVTQEQVDRLFKAMERLNMQKAIRFQPITVYGVGKLSTRWLHVPEINGRPHVTVALNKSLREAMRRAVGAPKGKLSCKRFEVSPRKKGEGVPLSVKMT
jgi:hypothetical protein